MENLVEQLQNIAGRMLEQNDSISALKIQDLIEKWRKNQMIVAFCGHFSAGKSSMINSLIGQKVLPSSPIPTSANLVLIEHGKNRAIAFRVDGGTESFELSEAGMKALKEFCADGQTVATIKIFAESEWLPQGIAIMDTPGIDSTDDAHRLVTESTLHLADVVYYVVDYNHVQSELNFQFTRQLLDHGKSVYLIVNQIDKHFDLEMDFSTYRESVEEAFSLWGIALRGIYFTSLMEEDHPENEYEQLRQDLGRQFQQRNEILAVSIRASAKTVIAEHIRIVRDSQERERSKWQQIIDAAEDLLTFSEARERLQAVQTEVEHLQKLPQTAKQEVLQKIDTLLDNAPLTPYPTIEQIEAFLQSRQEKFRIGWLGSKAKTEQERMNRLQALQADVQQRMQAAIEWHLTQLLSHTLQDYHITSEILSNRLQDFHVELNSERLLRLVNPGASLEGAYVHTYARDLSASIKSSYRQLANDWLQEFLTCIQTKAQEQIDRLLGEQQHLTQLIEAYTNLEALDGNMQTYEQMVYEQIGSYELNK
ncbi:dynamin family protein [Fodinisporobacter ferrooxydans]|uniref:Dynamin family protein n=1 Tax=Fodinisporobacter ferrooxydans TaxID=2901836 RepID=A0ABY4CL61_9BACL|nr:dynamin family protein [Alicyclobacillaceae bacterium MYW30-H2]